MPHSEIITIAFRTVWRQKPLWLFGLLGTLLPALAAGIFIGSFFVWQETFMIRFIDLAMTQEPDYLSVMRILSGGLGRLAAVWGAIACLWLVGYVVNLVTRAATASESGRALAGERSQSGRGLATGLRKSFSFFVIDLLWQIPLIVLAIGAVVFGFIVIVGLVRGASSSDASGVAVGFTGVFALIFGGLGCLSLLWLLFGVARGLFAPLMYQAAAQEHIGLGAAIRLGGRLARAHLGSMFVFFIFLTGLGVAFSFVSRIFTAPLSNFWTFRWTAMSENLANGIPPAPPSDFEQAGLFLVGLFFGLIAWLIGAIIRTFGLAMYAEVFRRLHNPANPAQLELAPEKS